VNLIKIIALCMFLLATCWSVENPATFTEFIPSQNGFQVDYGKHSPGDVLTLDVQPDPGCTILSKRVINPTPLGWVVGFTLTIPDNAAGVHVGTFGGEYACGSSGGSGGGGASKPPEWNGSAKVNVCAEQLDETDIPFTIDLDDDQFKWLKSVASAAKKIPFVRKADASLSISAKKGIGSECCEGNSDRTDFVELTGAGDGSIDLVLAWGLPHLALPELRIPLPGGRGLRVRAVLDVAISGGGSVTIGASVTGRLGECSCVEYAATISGRPELKAGASGFAGLEFLNRRNKVTRSFTGIDIEGSLTTGLTLAGEGKVYQGQNCPESEQHATLTLPDLVLVLRLNLLELVNFNFKHDFSEAVYSALGVTNPIILF
jgi:hypothetical protein